MDLQPYESDRDLDAIIRIWREVGWLDSSEGERRALEAFLSTGHGRVAIVDDAAKCLVHWTPGSIRYVDRNLPLCVITAVTTGRVGRKQGLATALTAAALVDGAASGAAVSALGMFEQGFYDRFGFGTGSYEHQLTFDPGSLNIDVPYRRPIRLTSEDWADVHVAMTGRLRSRGGVVLDPPRIMEAELGWMKSPFGLGYLTDGRLTHLVMGSAVSENGPYRIPWMAYETAEQLLELLALLKSLADQVSSVKMTEPPEIQLQDLLRNPIRQRIRTEKSVHETNHRALAWWQLRILDLAACVEARRWQGEDVAFSLDLRDPLDDLIANAGIGGEYTVTVGDPSGVTPGRAKGLPVLSATVNAFSRAWFGVRPPTSLAITDDLQAPPELLAALDAALTMPPPRVGWSF